MSNRNEMIFINRILNAELSIRKTAKQFGLRRDDLIHRIQEVLADDEDNLRQLDLVIVINKMLFDNVKMEDAAKELDMTVQEMDKKILKTLSSNEDKMQKYLDYKNGGKKKKPTTKKIIKMAKIQVRKKPIIKM